jgi:hypothetical protein
VPLVSVATKAQVRPRPDTVGVLADAWLVETQSKINSLAFGLTDAVLKLAASVVVLLDVRSVTPISVITGGAAEDVRPLLTIHHRAHFGSKSIITFQPPR